MFSDYKPEIDKSKELLSYDIIFLQEVIGILRWMIELGRVYKYHEESLLSSFQALPRIEHSEQFLLKVAYIKGKLKLAFYFDLVYAIVDENCFTGNTASAFQDQYCGATTELPAGMPKPRGRTVVMTAFVDASHAVNKVTQWSHTGFLMFLN